jgi:hypothetical protein
MVLLQSPPPAPMPLATPATPHTIRRQTWVTVTIHSVIGNLLAPWAQLAKNVHDQCLMLCSKSAIFRIVPPVSEPSAENNYRVIIFFTEVQADLRVYESIRSRWDVDVT